jgi:hypothetical protein
MFYTTPWNMIARITSLTTCVSLYTPPSYKHLLLMQAKYVHNMGNCWIHCGWMEISDLYILENTTTHTAHSTHHCSYHTLQFTVYLITSTSTNAYRTDIWWYALRNQIYNLESLGEDGRFHSVSHHNLISKIRFTCPFCTDQDTLSTYHYAHLRKILHTTSRILSMTSCDSPYTRCTYDHISFMQTMYVH